MVGGWEIFCEWQIANIGSDNGVKSYHAVENGEKIEKLSIWFRINWKPGYWTCKWNKIDHFFDLVAQFK